MINMSYCRFENTNRAMQEIMSAIAEGEHSTNDEGQLVDQDGEVASRREQQAFEEMICTAEALIDVLCELQETW